MRHWNRAAANTAIFVAIAIGITWFVTGGVVVYDYWWYGGVATIPVGNGPAILLCVDTHVQDSGVPFLLSYLSDEEPYSMDLSVYDYSADIRMLFIDEFIIEYPDDTTVQLVSPTDKWAKQLQDYTAINSSSNGLVYTHSLKVAYRFQQAVREPSDFRVKIRGRYLRGDGTVVDIDVGHRFHAERRETVTAGWKRWAEV